MQDLPVIAPGTIAAGQTAEVAILVPQPEKVGKLLIHLKFAVFD